MFSPQLSVPRIASSPAINQAFETTSGFNVFDPFLKVASAIGDTVKSIGSGVAQFGSRIQQAVRNNFFRPEGAEYIVGSERVRWARPGQGFMKVLEDFFPTIRPLAVAHDALLGNLKQAGMPLAIPGVPFELHPANVPTMPLAYVAGVAGAVFNLSLIHI